MNRESEGDALLKQAEKLCMPSVLQLRLKPDWSAATPLFEKAAACYSASPWQAGKQLAKAADTAREAGDWPDVVLLWRAAALAYAEASRHSAAAEALAKGALAVEQHDPKAACELYHEAIQALEHEGKAGQSGNLHRQAAGAMLRMGRSAEAVSMLLRWAQTADASGLANSAAKAYLGAVVVWLHAGDAAQAGAVYQPMGNPPADLQDAMDAVEFPRSEQARAGGELLDAYRSGDAGSVQRTAAKPVFMDLDNQVARLARKLPVGDLDAMAAKLGGAPVPLAADIAAGLDEDDLT